MKHNVKGAAHSRYLNATLRVLGTCRGPIDLYRLEDELADIEHYDWNSGLGSSGLAKTRKGRRSRQLWDGEPGDRHSGRAA
jgi:hypothetical protein